MTRRYLAAGLVLALAMTASTAMTASADRDLRGPARVIDGDTLEVAGRDVRLWGINAPELGAAGGRASRDHMRDLVAGQVVACVQAPGRDRYRRFLGRCTVNGEDLAGRIVRDVYATDWPCYSDGAYAADQASAESRRSGLWTSTGALVRPRGCRRPSAR